MLALSWTLGSAGQFHNSGLSLCLHCCSGPRRSISRDHPRFPWYRRSWVRPAEELVCLGNQMLFLVRTVWWLFLKWVEFCAWRIKVCHGGRGENYCLVVGWRGVFLSLGQTFCQAKEWEEVLASHMAVSPLRNFSWKLAEVKETWLRQGGLLGKIRVQTLSFFLFYFSTVGKALASVSGVPVLCGEWEHGNELSCVEGRKTLVHTQAVCF